MYAMHVPCCWPPLQSRPVRMGDSDGEDADDNDSCAHSTHRLTGCPWVAHARASHCQCMFVFVPASLLEYSMGRTHQRMYASIHKWLRHIFNGLLISIVATKWRHVFENNKSRRCTVYKLRARTTWCAALCRASLVFYFIFAGFNSLGICCWQTVSAWVSVTATTPIACVFAYNRPPLCLILI